MQRNNIDIELIEMIKQVKEDDTLVINCQTNLVDDVGLDSYGCEGAIRILN